MVKKLEEMSSKELEEYIRNLKKNIEKEDINISRLSKAIRSKKEECCPDVCDVINDTISEKHKELMNMDKKKYEIESQLSKVGIKTTKAHIVMKKESEVITNEINELKRLKETLRSHQICDCN